MRLQVIARHSNCAKSPEYKARLDGGQQNRPGPHNSVTKRSL